MNAREKYAKCIYCNCEKYTYLFVKVLKIRGIIYKLSLMINRP